MPALSVIDLAMFLLETEERPFNVGPLAILAPLIAERYDGRLYTGDLRPPVRRYRCRGCRWAQPVGHRQPVRGWNGMAIRSSRKIMQRTWARSSLSVK